MHSPELDKRKGKRKRKRKGRREEKEMRRMRPNTG
jgi:hypothetical protein